MNEIIKESMTELRDKTLKLCIKKHGDAKRRFSPEPYYIHPISVAFMVRRYGNYILGN